MFESNDTYVEEAVKSAETKKQSTVKNCFLALTIILLAATAIMPNLIFTILLIVSAIFTILKFSEKNVEYEYIYTNGSLDVAKIINNSKRKKVVSVESADVMMIAELGTNEALKYDNANMKFFDCSAHNEEKTDYILVGHSQEKDFDFKMLFTPGEKLMNAMKRYNKQKIYEK
ncbi:MAG: DUF6106 family protein [Pseudobutyrivibrio sp.]|nr:DUF6106 family protein [Pseudobutyrivibrio sp.]